MQFNSAVERIQRASDKAPTEIAFSLRMVWDKVSNLDLVTDTLVATRGDHVEALRRLQHNGDCD